MPIVATDPGSSTAAAAERTIRSNLATELFPGFQADSSRLRLTVWAVNATSDASIPLVPDVMKLAMPTISPAESSRLPNWRTAPEPEREKPLLNSLTAIEEAPISTVHVRSVPTNKKNSGPGATTAVGVLQLSTKVLMEHVTVSPMSVACAVDENASTRLATKVLIAVIFIL
jgi:hypothetical protein